MKICSRSLLLWCALAVLQTAAASIAAFAAESAKAKVVVISLDAFAGESLRESRLPAPTLQKLMRNGVWTPAMQPVNPTITWPNHTALVTGVDASRHHVLANGLIIKQRTDTAPQIDWRAPKSRLVAVPTVYDAAHAAGLSTAAVDWVAETGSESIDYHFAEHPDASGSVARELVQANVLRPEDLVDFEKSSQVWRDRIYARVAAEIVRRHHPDLLLLHLLSLDEVEHETGFGNNAGRDTIAFLDDRVKEVVDAVRDAGELDHTTFILVSDHGQQNAHKELHPDALLRQANLQSDTAVTRTYSLAEGGYALVFQQHATPASIAELKALFQGRPGIRSALTGEELAAEGLPTAAATDQAPDLFLFAAQDYVFRGGPSTDFLVEAGTSGEHGYPKTDLQMQAIFIASGAAIRPLGEISGFPNLDVAPTIAKLLDISLPNVQGKPLLQILKLPAK